MKNLRNLLDKHKQSRKSQRLNPSLESFKKYVEENVEPIVEAYISKSLSQMTYPRRVDIALREDKPWEFKSVKTITVGHNNLCSESHLANSSGSGQWEMIIDGKKIDYDLLVEWDVGERLLAVSLTQYKLERLLKGEYVINCAGEVSRILPGPKPRKIDDSILDNAEATVSRFKLKYSDELNLYQSEPMTETEMPIETVIQKEEPIDKEKYREIEDEMKGCIQALGWRWNQIDHIKMKECILHTMKYDEKSELCLKRYLQKGGK